MKPKIAFILLIAVLLTPACEYEPYELGEPKTLLAISRCSFYEQAFANKGKLKGEPWWEVYFTCSTESKSFNEKLFKTRYPELYRVSKADAGSDVTIEYCRYRSAPSVADVTRRVDALADQYQGEIGFQISIVENKPPCIAAGQELYE